MDVLIFSRFLNIFADAGDSGNCDASTGCCIKSRPSESRPMIEDLPPGEGRPERREAARNSEHGSCV